MRVNDRAVKDYVAKKYIRLLFFQPYLDLTGDVCLAVMEPVKGECRTEND